jgi:hypothetical protein
MQHQACQDRIQMGRSTRTDDHPIKHSTTTAVKAINQLTHLCLKLISRTVTPEAAAAAAVVVEVAAAVSMAVLQVAIPIAAKTIVTGIWHSH